jgi:hypothetical protein
MIERTGGRGFRAARRLCDVSPYGQRSWKIRLRKGFSAGIRTALK